jgi:hypothetical protein
MSSIEDIERAIQGLPEDQLARFRVWFAEFDADRFDEQIARDAAAGRLDRLSAEALEEHHRGETREL